MMKREHYIEADAILLSVSHMQREHVWMGEFAQYNPPPPHAKFSSLLEARPSIFPIFLFPDAADVVGSNLVDALSMSEQATSYDASTTKILKKITRQKMPISKGGIKGNLFLSAASFSYIYFCASLSRRILCGTFLKHLKN